MKTIDWKKIERTVGGLKFAVVLILLFSVAMIIGTFVESYYGTDFVNRSVYKTAPFILIQFGMLLSIVFAAFLRLPPQKRLYGFYTVHAGLVIIGIGSIITYIAGVDGQLLLNPNEPNREVILSKDVFKITYPDDNKQVTSELPYTAFPKKLNDQYEYVKLLEFIPFAVGEFVWTPAINTYPKTTPLHTSKYYFKNPFAEERITLTLHPEASNEFQSSVVMGPLSFNYMPEALSECFEGIGPSGLIVWNSETTECFSPESRRIPVNETQEKNRFVAFTLNGQTFTFFPDFSPFPMSKDFQVDQKSKMKIFSQKLFEDKPTLFLFGKKLSYYDKNQKQWVHENIELKGPSISLPWMGAEISLLEHEDKLVPFNLPTSTIPIQKNGALIKGDMRAVRLDILGKEYWVTNYSPLSLLIQGKKMIFEVGKESLILPFELSLTQFKMDKDPGTNNPASYESFVKLFFDGKMTNHHVFMNNPLKFLGFTFYQASYSQDAAGNYSSTLTVNVDQGRELKYLGSLMLVLGAAWHFSLNRKKGKKND